MKPSRLTRRTPPKPSKGLARTGGLKRTRLKRGKGMKRTGFIRKAIQLVASVFLPWQSQPAPEPIKSSLSRGKKTSPEVIDRERAWKQQHQSCACCGVTARWPKNQLHHILPSDYGRPDAEFNYLTLCVLCHAEANTSQVMLAQMIFLKRESDSDSYDPEAMHAWLSERSNRVLPDPEPLSGKLLQRRLSP